MPDRTADLLIRVADFLRRLSADQLDALASGEAKLEVVFKTVRPKAPAKLDLNLERVNLDLKALPDRASAQRYLTDLRLKKPEIASLAAQLDVPVSSKDTLSAIIGKIVEQKVGQRLDAEAIFSRR